MKPSTPCRFCGVPVVLTKLDGEPVALDPSVRVLRYDPREDQCRPIPDEAQLFGEHRHVCKILRKDAEVRALRKRAERQPSLLDEGPSSSAGAAARTPTTIEESEAETACDHGLEDYVDGACMMCGAVLEEA